MPVPWFSLLMYRAKGMRRKPTPAEGIAWALLRNRRCLGYKLGQARDSRRDSILAAAGVRVARIPNGELCRERLEAEIQRTVRSMGSGAHGKGLTPCPPLRYAERGRSRKGA